MLMPPWVLVGLQSGAGMEQGDVMGLGSHSPGSSWIRMWPCRYTAKGLQQGHDQLLVTSAALYFPGSGGQGRSPAW